MRWSASAASKGVGTGGVGETQRGRGMGGLVKNADLNQHYFIENTLNSHYLIICDYTIFVWSIAITMTITIVTVIVAIIWRIHCSYIKLKLVNEHRQIYTYICRNFARACKNPGVAKIQVLPESIFSIYYIIFIRYSFNSSIQWYTLW